MVTFDREVISLHFKTKSVQTHFKDFFSLKRVQIPLHVRPINLHQIHVDKSGNLSQFY